MNHTSSLLASHGPDVRTQRLASVGLGARGREQPNQPHEAKHPPGPPWLESGWLRGGSPGKGGDCLVRGVLAVGAFCVLAARGRPPKPVSPTAGETRLPLKVGCKGARASAHRERRGGSERDRLVPCSVDARPLRLCTSKAFGTQTSSRFPTVTALA